MTTIDKTILTSTVTELLKKGYTKSAIQRRMINEGMSEEDAKEFIEAIEKEFYNSNKQKSRIIWGTILLLSLITNFFIIPVTVSFENTFAISITFGLITGITAMQLIFSYRNISDFFSIFTQKTNEKDDKKQLIILIALIFFSIVINYTISKTKIENEFSNYGTNVKGTVLGGQEETSKRRRSTTTSYTLNYEFFTKDGKKIFSKYKVDESEYNKSYIGVSVDITYSKRNPKINKITKVNSSILDLYQKR